MRKPLIGGDEKNRRNVVSGEWRVARLAVVAVIALVFSMAGFVASAEAVVANVNQFGSPCAQTAPNNTTSNMTCTNPTIGAGSNRVMVLVITGEAGGNHTSMTETVRYGTADFTPVQSNYGNNDNRRYTWIGYVNESQIQANAGSDITMTITSDQTWAGTEAYYAVYEGVEQAGGASTVPGSDVNGSAGTSTALTNGPITSVVDGAAIYAVSVNATGTATSVPTNYTEHVDQADGSNNYITTIGSRVTTPGTSESISMTVEANRWTSVFMTLAPVSCVETATLTLTPISDPITGTVSVVATLGGSGGSNVSVGTTPAVGQSSGWNYVPAQDDNTTVVNFYAQADGFCGPIYDSQLGVSTDTMAAPTITAFTIPASVIDTAAPLDIPITTFTAADNVAVTGYMIKVDDNTTPGSGDVGWVGSAPTSVTVGSYGSYTLYAWTKDAAGNVSAVASDSTTISDCSPTVTEITLSSDNASIDYPETSANLSIAVTGGSGGIGSSEWSVNGVDWFGTGTAYTAPTQTSGSETIMGRAVEAACGTTLTTADLSQPYDTRTPFIEPGTASRTQLGTDKVRITAPFLGINDNTSFSVSVDYFLNGSAQTTVTVDPVTGTGPQVIDLGAFSDGDNITNLVVTYADTRWGAAPGNAVQNLADITLVAWVDDQLLHNSLRFACSVLDANGETITDQATCENAPNNGTWNEDRRYAGGWGTSGGDDQYGPIICATCHEKLNGGNTNIKRITDQVTLPGIPGASETVLFTSTVDGSSDMGDANGAHVASDNICEVCHTYSPTDVNVTTPTNGVRFHGYDMSGAAAADQNHYIQGDCIACHNHNVGFRASCAACHGNPPGSLVTTKTTGSGTAGAHDGHVNTLGYACDRCHSGSVGAGATHDSDGTVTITFANLPTGTGGANGGSYSGQTGVLYDTTDGGTTSVPGANDGNMTCANYCHGNTLSAPNAATWSGAVTCGDCHGDDTNTTVTTLPSGTSHDTHVNTLNLTCDNCHGSGFGGNNHVDGEVAYNVSLLTTNYLDTRAANVAYNGNEVSSSGGLAPSGTYASCSNVTCHWNNHPSVTLTTPNTPVWNNGPASCTTCHNNGTDDGQLSNAAPASGKHPEHVDASDTYVTCDNCHGVGATAGTHTGHINQQVNFYGTISSSDDNLDKDDFFGETTRNTVNDDYCATVCHRQADWGDGSVATTASDPANEGTIDWSLDCSSVPVQDACVDCHSDLYSGEAGPQVITGWAVTPAGTHLEMTSGQGIPGNTCADVTNWKTRCNGCHDKHAGTVQIPVPTAGADQAALGLVYDGIGHDGYVKLLPQSGSSTEAETCWNCHTATENEWNSSPYSASTENWTTASFPSPAAGIPARTVRSVHTGNVNVAGISSVNEYLNWSDRGNVEPVADIRCTYCHDLHSLGVNGYTPASAPYLRGTWMSNPYSLDRPPMNGDTYAQNAFDSYQPDSPRLFATTTDSKTKPGYFIDQNSDWPTVKTPASGTFYTYAETAGLCQLCHQASTDAMDEYAGTSLWNGANNGHANSALGGSGAASGNNIFDASRANNGADNGNYMGAQHGAEQRVTGSPTNNYGKQSSQAPTTNPKSDAIFRSWSPSQPANSGNSGIPADNLGWFGGTAQDRNNLGDQYDTWYKGAGGGVGTAGTYNISGVYVGTSPRAHNFTCSKCHDPHASGLPALLTTNCLDVVRSTWTNGNAGPVTGNAWGRQAAVTCHRKWSTTSENGWNTLAPNL